MSPCALLDPILLNVFFDLVVDIFLACVFFKEGMGRDVAIHFRYDYCGVEHYDSLLQGVRAEPAPFTRNSVLLDCSLSGERELCGDGVMCCYGSRVRSPSVSFLMVRTE